MSNSRAKSHYQMYRTDFVFADYSFIDEEGTFTAVLDNKMWGRMNLTAFFTLEDGRKIMASAFQNDGNYLGLGEIDPGSTVELTFRGGKKSPRIYLRGVELIAPPPDEPDDGEEDEE
ncbi:MAG: hypothetical protein IKO51_00765 [Clostridia bacterium]|nr:hypothetical protein [Clostridia bacterium]